MQRKDTNTRRVCGLTFRGPLRWYRANLRLFHPLRLSDPFWAFILKGSPLPPLEPISFPRPIQDLRSMECTYIVLRQRGTPTHSAMTCQVVREPQWPTDTLPVSRFRATEPTFRTRQDSFNPSRWEPWSFRRPSKPLEAPSNPRDP